jgi:hypothetical protein
MSMETRNTIRTVPRFAAATIGMALRSVMRRLAMRFAIMSDALLPLCDMAPEMKPKSIPTNWFPVQRERSLRVW